MPVAYKEQTRRPQPRRTWPTSQSSTLFTLAVSSFTSRLGNYHVIDGRNTYPLRMCLSQHPNFVSARNIVRLSWCCSNPLFPTGWWLRTAGRPATPSGAPAPVKGHANATPIPCLQYPRWTFLGRKKPCKTPSWTSCFPSTVSEQLGIKATDISPTWSW